MLLLCVHAPSGTAVAGQTGFSYQCEGGTACTARARGRVSQRTRTGAHVGDAAAPAAALS